MVFADDIRQMILKVADERGTQQIFRPSDVARRMDNTNWHLLLDQISLVASILEKEGKIVTAHNAGQAGFVKSFVKAGTSEKR